MTAAAEETPRNGPGSLGAYLAAIAVCVAAFWLAYAGDFLTLVQKWWRSDTHAHGLLVLPVAGYYVWQRRARLGALPNASPALGLLVASALCAVVAASVLADTAVVRHAALMVWPTVVVLALGGIPAVKILAFPLAFLLFGVPVGDALIPHLIDWTATMTVSGLRLLGIPVHRDGAYFSIPAGDFAVVEACSGSRYLMATLMTGALYSQGLLSTTKSRALMMLASIVLPIVGNGLRALGIVLIAHLSDMRYATGADHLVYGWLFYGVICVILLGFGAFLRRRERPEVAPEIPFGADQPKVVSGFRGSLLAPILLLALVLVTRAGTDRVTAMKSALPTEFPGLSISPLSSGWEPAIDRPDGWTVAFPGAAFRERRAFSVSALAEPVVVEVASYGAQRQGAELVGMPQRFWTEDSWNLLDRSKYVVRIDADRSWAVTELMLGRSQDRKLVWYWYRIHGASYAGDTAAKIAGALALLRGTEAQGIVVLSTPASRGASDPRERLRMFLGANADRLDACAEALSGCKAVTDSAR